MINKRKRVFVFISVLIALILAGVLFYFFIVSDNNNNSSTNTPTDQKQVENQNNNTNSIESITQNQQQTSTENNQADLDTQIDPRTRAKQIARIFVERFASYSSQNDNQHIETVMSLVSDNMADWVENQEVEQGAQYSGITTNVIVTNLTSYNEGNSATVELDTQQTISTPTSSQKKQKSGRVELIRQSDQWKVDGFYWDEN